MPYVVKIAVTYGSESECATHYTTAPHEVSKEHEYKVGVALSLFAFGNYLRSPAETKCNKRLLQRTSVLYYKHYTVTIKQ